MGGTQPRMEVALGRLRLRNPVLTASGTSGYGLDLTPHVDLSRLGGIVCKSLSLLPREGNPPCRIVETPSGMLNSIGLQNIGIEAFLSEKLPALREHDVAVIVNIFGETVEEFAALARRADQAVGIAALELNISCPNTDKGGIEFGVDPEATARVTEAVRRATRLPLIVKLSPNAGDVVACARAAVESGAEALSLINTVVGMAIDLAGRRPKIGFTTGGLSGPAIRPIAVRMVWEVRRALPQVPIFGMGGIESLEHVLEFLIAGANAVQIGTANFRDPGVSGRLVTELAEWCAENGIARVSELTGTLQTRPRPDHRYA